MFSKSSLKDFLAGAPVCVVGMAGGYQKWVPGYEVISTLAEGDAD